MSENRALVLLKAARDILKKCQDSTYVLNAMEVTAVWDEATCDGYCLLEEISVYLEDNLDRRLEYEGMWEKTKDELPPFKEEVRLYSPDSIPQFFSGFLLRVDHSGPVFAIKSDNPLSATKYFILDKKVEMWTNLPSFSEDK